MEKSFHFAGSTDRYAAFAIQHGVIDIAFAKLRSEEQRISQLLRNRTVTVTVTARISGRYVSLFVVVFNFQCALLRDVLSKRSQQRFWWS